MIGVQASLGSWTASAGPDTFTDAAGFQWDLTDIDGWWGGIGTRSYAVERVRGDGSHDGPLYLQGRQVTLTGNVTAQTSDGLQAAMDVVAGLLMQGDRTGTLVVSETTRGQALQAGCRVSTQPRAKRIAELVATWEVPLFCADPLRYGPTLTATIGLPVAGAGISYPITYPLSYGTPTGTGQIVLSNPGTSDTPIVFTVTGSLPSGFSISVGAQQLVYPVAVPTGQPVVIDTGAGTVLVEGTADRRVNLTQADWIQVPSRSSLTVQFTSLGGAYDPAASLSASWAPAYW